MKIDFVTRFTLDPGTILTPAQKASRKLVYRFCGYTRKIARNSIKLGETTERSQPGDAPVGHRDMLYRRFIDFGVSGDSGSIGAMVFQSNAKDLVPKTIEHGGRIEAWAEDPITGQRQKIIVEMAARPAMRLAFEKAKEKHIAALIENSILKEA
jgi:hypothetical protein